MPQTALLYTFVLPHYAQEEYIFSALDSIFSQTYSNIELIIVDDHTKDFDAKRVFDYVEEHKPPNIRHFKLIVNDENMGTVRSLNNAMQKAQGDYLHIFAADDRMADEHVAQNFVDKFSELGEDAQIISGQTLMYDLYLKEFQHYFTPKDVLLEMGAMTAQEQYRKTVSRCAFAVGGCCFRKSLWQQQGPFDLARRLVEDWPFFLKVTRNGVKIHMAFFHVLDHREGGISHDIAMGSPLVKQYCEDRLSVYETEILPYLKEEQIGTQLAIYRSYMWDINDYVNRYGSRGRVALVQLLRYSPALALAQVWNNAVVNYKKAIKFGVLGMVATATALAACLVIVSQPAAVEYAVFGLTVAHLFSTLLTPVYILFLLFAAATALGILFACILWAKEAVQRWRNK